MSNRGKFWAVRSAEFDDLLITDLEAFVVLSLIASRVHWSDIPSSDGLKKGQARISQYIWENASFSRYRITRGSMKEILKRLKATQLITYETTHQFTIVTLTSSCIYDLNLDMSQPSEQPSEQPANNPRTTHEQPTTYIMSKKEKKEKKEKKPYTPSPSASAMVDEFYSSLLKEVPTVRIGANGRNQQQHRAMERLLQLHGEVKVRSVFVFSHTDEFWHAHVHTPFYLEKKFDQLCIKASQQKNTRSMPPVNANRALAELFDQQWQAPDNTEFQIEERDICFLTWSQSGHTKVKKISFNENGFMEQVENEALKRGFVKKVLNSKIEILEVNHG